MKKYYSSMVVVYSFIFYILYFNGNIQKILAKNIVIYNLIAINIMLILMLLTILFKKKWSFNFAYLDLILLIPLIFIFIGDANRNVVNVTSTIKFQELEDPNFILGNKTNIIDYTIKDQTYVDIVFTIQDNLDHYYGKRIKIRGLAIQNKSSDYFSIGKNYITCCAADAVIIGFVVKNTLNKTIVTNHYYEVTGILVPTKSKTDSDKDVILIAENIQDISKEDSSVYDCYVYGNEYCGTISNFTN